jgi:hypothetical protein
LERRGEASMSSIGSYIRDKFHDPRLYISEIIAQECLDKMELSLKNSGIDLDHADLIILAISIYRKIKKGGKDRELIYRQDCEKIYSKGPKRQILNYVRMDEEHLAYLYAAAIEEFGIENISDFGMLSKKWEEWAEEGLKILYCNYFLPNYPTTPSAFYEKMLELSR